MSTESLVSVADNSRRDDDAPEQTRPRRRRSRLWKSLRQNKLALVSIIIIVVSTAIAAAAPYISPYDPEAVELLDRAIPPFWSADADPRFLLGTDMLGRDVLTRLIYGGRISLFVGLTSVLVAGAIGTTLGLLAGFYQGIVDDVIMRLVEIQLSFPVLLLAVTVLAVLGPGLMNIILVLGAISWAVYARVVRAETMRLREQEFIEAARAIGAGSPRMIWKHILPNVWGPVIVVGSFSVGTNILAESALSFLGLGTEPTVPSWGRMLATGKEHLNRAPWLAIFPGLALVLIVLSINIAGDWLRDYLDPRMRTD